MYSDNCVEKFGSLIENSGDFVVLNGLNLGHSDV